MKNKKSSLKMNSVAENSFNKFIPGQSRFKIHRSVLKIDKGGTRTDGPTNKEIVEDVPWFTPEL